MGLNDCCRIMKNYNLVGAIQTVQIRRFPHKTLVHSAASLRLLHAIRTSNKANRSIRRPVCKAIKPLPPDRESGRGRDSLAGTPLDPGICCAQPLEHVVLHGEYLPTDGLTAVEGLQLGLGVAVSTLR